MEFKKIKIPKYWKYTESWCDKNIEDKYDLNKICKSKQAAFSIQYEIYEGGANVHLHCKNLNIMIDQFDDLLKERKTFDQLDTFHWELRGDQSGYEFDTHVDKNIERIYKKYNVDLAPDFIKEKYQEMINMAKMGIAKYKEVCSYINEIEKQRQDKFLNDQEEKYSYTYQRGNQIELNHVKVESGFVYILSNELMPNIYKVGFTARNPDERAVEITSKSGLPKPFKVEKYWRSDDPFIVEQRIHGALSEFAQGREFFKGDLNEICEFIDYLVQSNNEI